MGSSPAARNSRPAITCAGRDGTPCRPGRAQRGGRFRGAHASRVLVAASRRDELPAACGVMARAHRIRRVRKFAKSGRLRAARRAASPRPALPPARRSSARGLARVRAPRPSFHPLRKPRPRPAPRMPRKPHAEPSSAHQPRCGRGLHSTGIRVNSWLGLSVLARCSHSRISSGESSACSAKCSGTGPHDPRKNGTVTLTVP